MKMQPVNRVYPEQRGPLADFHAWDAHKQTLDRLYDLQDEFNQYKADNQKSNVGPKESANSVIATQINGLFVKAVPPQNGQKLTYNSSTGQIEWQ